MSQPEPSPSFSFTPPLDEDYAYDSSDSSGENPTLGWIIRILEEFHTVLGHCLAVSYSLENNLDELQDIPENSWPSCQVTTGSVLIQFLSDSPDLWAANGIVILLAVIKMGPQLISLPHRIRERWYLDAARAERARQALETLWAARTEEVMRQRNEFRIEPTYAVSPPPLPFDRFHPPPPED
jgi:hypothetical protein